MKTGEEKNEAEKQRDPGITGMPRCNNYAVFGPDMLLPLERVLKFCREADPLQERIEACPRMTRSGV
jgi:hypothetical protein